MPAQPAIYDAVPSYTRDLWGLAVLDPSHTVNFSVGRDSLLAC